MWLFSAVILSDQSWWRDADQVSSNLLLSQVLLKQDELQLSTLSYLILLLISPTMDDELLDEAKHRLPILYRWNIPSSPPTIVVFCTTDENNTETFVRKVKFSFLKN